MRLVAAQGWPIMGADEEETMGWSLPEAKSGKKTAENQRQMLYLVTAS